MDGMNFLRRVRRFRGQTTSEYMVVIAVTSLALLMALDQFSKPDGVVQTAAEDAAVLYHSGLSNSSSGKMRVE